MISIILFLGFIGLFVYFARDDYKYDKFILFFPFKNTNSTKIDLHVPEGTIIEKFEVH